LLRAGLASNKGTLLLGVLIGVYFQFDDQIDAMIDFEKLVRLFAAQATTQGIIVVGIIAVVAALLLFRLLGMAWFVLRFFGYQLTRQGDDLRIQCGLLTKISATIPRPRIQFISIQRNLFQRWMKLASIRIETAGGSGGEDSAKTVSSRWFVPVLAENQVASLLDQLRPGLSWSEDALDWKQVSPLAPRRLARLAVLASIAIGLGGLAISQPWGAFIGLAALPVLIWLAIKKSHARRYARTRQGVVYRSGIFNRKTSMTFFEKIQTVRLDESPFDRRWGMATLCVDTAAAGPAEHHIHVHYLTGDFAREEYDAIVAQSSSEVPVFG
jgi:putative membrane protein